LTLLAGAGTLISLFDVGYLASRFYVYMALELVLPPVIVALQYARTRRSRQKDAPAAQ
jgi:hypothetical protein